MQVNIEILGIPFAKQSFRYAAMVSKKTGKAFVAKYQPKKVTDGEKNIRAQIIQQLPQGFIPFTGPVFVTWLEFVFPPVTSLKRADRDRIAQIGWTSKFTKPDLADNLMKGLFDAMAGIVYLNDSQICEMHNVRKVYGDTPKIKITLEGSNV